MLMNLNALLGCDIIMDIIIIIALIIYGIKVLTNIRGTRLTKYLE